MPAEAAKTTRPRPAMTCENEGRPRLAAARWRGPAGDRAVCILIPFLLSTSGAVVILAVGTIYTVSCRRAPLGEAVHRCNWDLWCSLECTPACQAGGRGFKSRQVRGRIAQLVERAPEKCEVAGSTPAPTTGSFRAPPGARNTGPYNVFLPGHTARRSCGPAPAGPGPASTWASAPQRLRFSGRGRPGPGSGGFPWRGSGGGLRACGWL